MKLTYSLLAAALACGFASAQTTAYTTPVGYVTLDIPASADSTVGQPLHRPTELAAASTSITGNTVGVTAGSLTANQFVYSSPTQIKTYYLLVTSGALAGRYFEIDTNTANDITVLSSTTLQDMGFTAGTSFSVIPYWTLNTLFPNGAGVGANTDFYSPTTTVQFRSLEIGQDRAAFLTYYYYAGGDDGPAGWYDLATNAGGQEDNLIDPFMMATVRNGEAVPNSVVITGEVPTVQVKTPMITGAAINDNYLTTQVPVDMTLTESGLQSVLTPAPDIYTGIDTVFVYNEAAAGYDKAAYNTYIYYAGGDDGPAGWYDLATNTIVPEGEKVLKAGRAYVIRRDAGTPGVGQITTPLPYSL